CRFPANPTYRSPPNLKNIYLSLNSNRGFAVGYDTEDDLGCIRKTPGRPGLRRKSFTMNWLVLIVAGLFEVVWATALKYTEGFTKPVPSLITVAAMVVSFYLLSLALRSIPPGSGYAVCVGIGAVGTAVLG